MLDVKSLKMGSSLKDKVDDCDSYDCKVNVVVDKIKKSSDNRVFVHNPDSEYLINLAESLVDNYDVHGDFLCPCKRVIEGDNIEKIICPCDDFLKEIEDNGHCTCLMYFSM